MSRKIKLALVGLALTAGGFLGGWMAGQPEVPSCPTEDSCTVDYQDGQWVIEPAVP